MSKKTSEENNAKILEAELIARYFGFIKQNPEPVNKEDEKAAIPISRQKKYLGENLFPIEELIANLRRYKNSREREMVEPELAFYDSIASGRHHKHRKKSSEEMVGLQIINVEGSVAEATLIETTKNILEEHDIKNILIKLNDVGDKDSLNAYYKEATSYYRKNINELNSHCRQLFKESTHALVTKGKNQCVSVHENAPKPMDFLDEEARKRFGEVLEYLEMLEIPYEVDHTVLGDPNYSTHTVFEFIDQNTKKVIAAGTRYDSLAKRGGLKKDIPSATVLINLPNPKYTNGKSIKKFDKARFYFLQIGYAAKLKSLPLINELRKEKIPILHKIYRDRLTSQISSAKKAECDYLIIVGQKEALSDELIIRDRESRSQKIIQRSELISHLKSL